MDKKKRDNKTKRERVGKWKKSYPKIPFFTYKNKTSFFLFFTPSLFFCILHISFFNTLKKNSIPSVHTLRKRERKRKRKKSHYLFSFFFFSILLFFVISSILFFLLLCPECILFFQFLKSFPVLAKYIVRPRCSGSSKSIL